MLAGAFLYLTKYRLILFKILFTSQETVCALEISLRKIPRVVS